MRTYNIDVYVDAHLKLFNKRWETFLDNVSFTL